VHVKHNTLCAIFCQEGDKVKGEHKSIAVNVTLETQFYEYDPRPYKQMKISQELKLLLGKVSD
jgi:hypothetical protein